MSEEGDDLRAHVDRGARLVDVVEAGDEWDLLHETSIAPLGGPKRLLRPLSPRDVAERENEGADLRLAHAIRRDGLDVHPMQARAAVEAEIGRRRVVRPGAGLGDQRLYLQPVLGMREVGDLRS